MARYRAWRGACAVARGAVGNGRGGHGGQPCRGAWTFPASRLRGPEDSSPSQRAKIKQKARFIHQAASRCATRRQRLMLCRSFCLAWLILLGQAVCTLSGRRERAWTGDLGFRAMRRVHGSRLLLLPLHSVRVPLRACSRSPLGRLNSGASALQQAVPNGAECGAESDRIRGQIKPATRFAGCWCAVFELGAVF